MVEKVNELSAEFEAEPVVRSELRVLERGEINILAPVAAQVRFRARIGSIAEASGFRKGGGVEPLSKPLVKATGGHFSGTNYRRSRASHVRNAGVSERTIAASNAQGETTLQCNDGVNAPATK